MIKSFHGRHRLQNKKVVIVKLVNQCDTLALLRNKKLSELSPDKKRKLKTNKVYVNESLCPSYKCIITKCNALLKKKYIASFYTINGKIKITYEANNGIVTSVVNHEEDLLEIFSKDIVDEINYERAAQQKLVTSSVIPSIETSNFICHPRELICFYVRLAIFAERLA